MMRAHTRARAVAAFIAGITLGAVISAGTALLLYTGQGFLRAAGLLVASTVMALAAGIWGGAPEKRNAPVSTRGSWIACAVVLIAAGVFVTFWSGRPELREMAAGGAIAVLLVLALPAYTTGALLSALHARDRSFRAGGSGVAMAAAAGAGLGILLATTLLIQTLEPFAIFYGGAAAVALAAVLDRAPHMLPHRAGADMADRVVLVTGTGDRGQLGYTIARAFLDAGAQVVISARGDDVVGIADELAAHGTVSAVPGDLLVDDDIARIIAHVHERHGGLDALINVAGGLSVSGSVEDTDAEEWTREFERNTTTTVRMCRAALPLLRERHGAIVNFASPAGARAVARLGAYSAAKAGVIALTRSLAVEERTHGVRVNAIAPGMIDTEQNRRESGEGTTFVPREDVADVAVFLASPAARSITGETIHVLGATIR